MTSTSSSIHADLIFTGPPDQLERLRDILKGIDSHFRGVTVSGSLEIKISNHEVIGDSSLLNRPIKDLIGPYKGSLYSRTTTCLLRGQINTVGELTEQTPDDLLAITNFGTKSLELVKERLAEHGLSLREGN